MTRFTRGFTGRGRGRDARLPPGQYDTGTSWPVLTAEVTPRIETAGWTFTIDGLVEHPTTWTWDEMHALPPSTYDGAIHCVTTWSKFDMQWRGVSLDTLLAIAQSGTEREPRARAIFHRLHDESAARRRHRRQGLGRLRSRRQTTLSPDHGGPARLLVPHLYFWKSAKFVAGITVLDHDEPGFWEVRGHHDRGDPWLEQRYQGD